MSRRRGPDLAKIQDHSALGVESVFKYIKRSLATSKQHQNPIQLPLATTKGASHQ